MSQTTDVLIIGAGIAGAALACALRNTGIRVHLLEKSAAPLDTARGDHLQPHTVEILERWGVLDDFFVNGAEKRLGSVWYADDGESLLRSSFDGLDLPHPYYIFLNHELIGQTLLDAALTSDQVTIERPIRNWWPAERSDGLHRIRVGAIDGSETTISARIVVGADGRSSRVRREFGFGAETHRYDRPIVVLFASPAHRGAANDLEVHLNEQQMVAVIPRTGGGCKIGVPIDQADVPAWRNATEVELRDRLRALAPQLDVSDVRYADVYPPVYLRADSWVADGVVLIGDACHAMHPARSQGMNVSIRCIDVLAQKLAALRGRFGEGATAQALADYESEMKPVIDALLEKNHEHGLAMDRSGSEDYLATCESLRGVAANPAIRAAFAMNASGYTKS